MTIGDGNWKGRMKMPDREKYIEILSKTAKTVREFNEDTPIKISLECIEDILELLKEQEKQKFFVDENRKITPLPVVVRCKDCKHHGEWSCAVCINELFETAGNWYCADGEKAVSE